MFHFSQTSRPASHWIGMAAACAVALAGAGLETRAGEVEAAFLEVAHAVDLAAVGLVVDAEDDVQCLEDPPVVHDRVTQLRRRAARREQAQDVVGRDGAGVGSTRRRARRSIGADVGQVESGRLSSGGRSTGTESGDLDAARPR